MFYIRPCQISLSEVRAGEPAAPKIDIAEVGVREAGSFRSNASEVLRKVNSHKKSFLEQGLLEIRLLKIRRTQQGFAKISVLKVYSFKIGGT